MKYIDASRTVSLRLHLESNCQPYHQPLYLELPWSADYQLDVDKHPREAIIYIFDKMVELSFSKPVKQTLRQKLYIDYQRVKMSPSTFESIPINTMNLNYFLIKDKQGILMDKKELDKLWRINYPFMCSVQEDREYFVCDIKNIR